MHQQYDSVSNTDQLYATYQQQPRNKQFNFQMGDQKQRNNSMSPKRNIIKNRTTTKTMLLGGPQQKTLRGTTRQQTSIGGPQLHKIIDKKCTLHLFASKYHAHESYSSSILFGHEPPSITKLLR